MPQPTAAVIPSCQMLLTVLNLLSYTGQPASAQHSIPYLALTSSLFLLLFSYAIHKLFLASFHMLWRSFSMLRALMQYASYYCHMLLLLRPRPLYRHISRMAPELLPLSIYCLSDFFLPPSSGPTSVYKEAALLLGEACQSIRLPSS
jgi:hypothetical protein